MASWKVPSSLGKDKGGRKYRCLGSIKPGGRKVKESLTDKVIVKQMLESVKEVNNDNIWGKYILCRGNR